MATRFVRIDLSDTARDYRPIAVEPGVAMLDRTGSNNRILFRWLGGLVAEPVWEEDSVSFYVRDDHGGRFEDVICQPATQQDLQTILKDDLAKLKSRIEKSVAETPTERILRKTLVRSFQELVDNPARTDHDSYFFRYRDVQGNWRLVWCWGYQRLDQEPAPSVVCTDPECNLLFVRRPGRSPKCPSCESTLTYRKVRKTNWRVAAIAALLLLLLAAGIGWWMTQAGRLIASPQTFTGQVGTRFDLKVLEAGMFRKKDVTRDAVGIVFDPRVARFDPATGMATLLAPGATLIHFQVGDRKTDVALNVGAATMPEKLVIEPKTVELGVGTTQRLKAIGEFPGGNKVDLTYAVQWKPLNDNIVYAAGGLVEGLAAGSSAVTATYRATPDASPVEASANVSVAKIDFASLEVKIAPDKLGVGRHAGLEIDAVADDGTKYSVLESSQLKTDISPSSVASLFSRSLRGDRQGHGKLAASFGPDELAGEQEFDVGTLPPVDFLVQPENIAMAVGEIMDLSVMSSSREPIRITSSAPDIVQVTADNRLVGRAVGDAEIQVRQGGNSASVNATVSRLEFESIAIDPGSLAVAVDGTLRPRVLGQTTGDGARPVELAPEFLACDKAPSPKYADFNRRTLELRGVAPTDPSIPQDLAMRFSIHKAAAPVEVVVAPCRLELTPAGPVDLPVGQLMRLQGWAHYSGGRRVQVPSERLAWQAEQKTVDGLKLYNTPRGAVGALKAGVGPLSVFASYFNTASNHVTFKSVEADPTVRLAIDVDRTLRLRGEPGQALLLASGAAGDVELVPELAIFKSSADTTVKIAEKSGAFVAAAPGEAEISATHLAAKDPASVKLRVCDPANASLVLEPTELKLAVNEQTAIRLFLEVKEGGKTDRVELNGPSVGYSLSDPSAVRWSPPVVTGLHPATVTLSAGHIVMSRPATAKIEVVDGSASSLRIMPSSLSLAPGQSASLVVEQQVGDQWKEVRPDGVAWTVPPALDWSPASADLRPAVTMPPGISGEFELRAKVGDQQAAVTVGAKAEGPDAKDAEAKLVLLREPAGRYLPVGRSQRYAVLVEKDGGAEPAAEVRWPANFENEFVKWETPVLTAKKAGYTQWLRAEAGGRGVLFHTTTYTPGELPPPAPTAEPESVARQDRIEHGDLISLKIIGDDSQSVQFPVGATFKDFRVEAKYKDGFTRLATKRCILRTPEPPDSAPLTADRGALIGVRPGKTTVTAEYDGMKSQAPPLEVEILAGVDADKIVLEPSPITMRPNETFGLRAIGSKGGKSIGDITGLGNITWQADNDAVRVNGPSVTGVKLGQASVTAKFGAVTSEPARVSVVDSIAEGLRLTPEHIQLRVGESLQLGSGLNVLRGNLDISQQCDVASEAPGVVRFAPESRSLIGVATGTAPVSFIMGDKIVRARIDVLPAATFVSGEGEVVIEPAAINLAPGQLERVRVLIITDAGERIDRTSSAVLRSTDDKVVKVQGDQVWGIAPGQVKIRATFSGAPKPAEASVQVHNEPIDDLMIEPDNLRMSVRDRVHLHILGCGKTAGWHELYPQEQLKTVAGGKNPAAIQIVGSHQVDAVALGEATADVSLGSQLKRQVQIKVENNPLTNLQIEPGQATVHPGDAVPYQVTAMKGGERRVLGPADGVTVNVDNSAVGQVIDGLTVGATGPGRAVVVARLADMKAEATLEVTARPADGVVQVPDNDAIVYRQGDVYGTDRIVIGPDGDVVIREPGVDVIRDGTSVVEVPGNVKALRFEPDILRMGTNAQPALVRVFEVLDNGRDGRDVTADPNLQVDPPSEVAKLEKTNEGPVIHPMKPGQSRVGAKLGNLASQAPLLIDIGGDAPMSGRLLVAPDPLVLWSGETARLAGVHFEPGGDQPLSPVEYKVTVPEGQGIVSVDAENNLKAASNGTVQATVTATDPKYNGLSSPLTIQVTAAEKLRIEPAELSLKVGEKTGLIRVVAQTTDGTTVDVPALVQSADENVLASTPETPGQFLAKGQGQTKLTATYRGVEVAPATVSITGERFQRVTTARGNRTKDGFDVSIEVLAAGSEGELEYRVYAADQPPAENWVPNQAEGDSRKVVLRSPQLPHKGEEEMYQLVIEARDKAGKSVEKYPLTFQLETVVKQTAPGTGPVPKQNF